MAARVPYIEATNVFISTNQHSGRLGQESFFALQWFPVCYHVPVVSIVLRCFWRNVDVMMIVLCFLEIYALC